MSVIGFTREEIIGVLTATWNRGSIGSTDAQRYLGHLAELGNKILIANNGRDFSTLEILHGLVSLYDAALSLAELRQEVRS